MKYKKVVNGLLICSAVLVSAGTFYLQSHLFNETSAQEQSEIVVQSSETAAVSDSSQEIADVVSSESSAVIVEEPSESSQPVVESTTPPVTESTTESSQSTEPSVSTEPTESTSSSEAPIESSSTEPSETTDSSSSTATDDSSTTDSSTTPAPENPSGGNTETPSPTPTPAPEGTTTATPAEQQVIQAIQPPLTSGSVESNYNYSVTANKTTAEFIEAIGKDAQEIAWNADLYASVMIAQAILETGSGNSRLSSEPNFNLFGIKGNYNGESVSFNTQEDDGSGTLYTIQASFRKYPSYRQSLEDYAELLRGGIQGNSSFYSQTWKVNADSYQDVTAFLTGRYATDTYYNLKLNALIEAYNLTDYDQKPNADETSSAASESAEANSNSAQLSGNTKVNSVSTNNRSSQGATIAATKISGNSLANDVITKSIIQSPANQILGSLSPWNKINQ
ncbi:glucosaminidase domain-containing protein [Enterococcus sp. HY326]|uniref:glucosaminidase domain-containing protein n=1 Tax=Enterococcus sp. HY326 TaxID=2971265 RepID=UPI00223F6F5B|nr:glucosaminidase domain-containing protein [Enterococcus sp. HY326]